LLIFQAGSPEKSLSKISDSPACRKLLVYFVNAVYWQSSSS